MMDHSTHVPLGARRRHHPLIGTNIGDQITHSSAPNGEILRSGCHLGEITASHPTQATHFQLASLTLTLAAREIAGPEVA